MTTDADLRLVAETVGFRVAPVHDEQGYLLGYNLLDPDEEWDGEPLPADMNHFYPDPIETFLCDLRTDDGAAARYLLPWLQRKAREQKHTVGYHYDPEDEEHEAAFGRQDSHGDWVGRIATKPSFAEALFDLTLQLAKENQT